MEETQVDEPHPVKFRRDATKFLLYFLFIFLFVGIWFLTQSSRTLENIEEQNRLFIEEISKHLSDGNQKRDITDPVKLLPLDTVLGNHKVTGNHFTTGWAYPKNESSSESLPAIQTTTTLAPYTKRIVYLWWIFAAVKLALAGFSLYGTTSACINWSHGDAGYEDKMGCVTGCVATAVGTMATVNKAAFDYDVINRADHTWLASINDAWQKRDSGLAAEYLTGVHQMSEAMAELSGFPTLTVLHSNLSMVKNDQTGYPVHFLMRPDGLTHRMSAMLFTNSTWFARFIHTESNSTNYEKRDESYNMENFSNGGIEASGDYVDIGNGVLSMQYDWGQLVHEVSCYLGDESGNAYQYQIYNNNAEDTMTSGRFRGFDNEPFDQDSLTPDPQYIPVEPWPQCEVS